MQLWNHRYTDMSARRSREDDPERDGQTQTGCEKEGMNETNADGDRKWQSGKEGGRLHPAEATRNIFEATTLGL